MVKRYVMADTAYGSLDDETVVLAADYDALAAELDDVKGKRSSSELGQIIAMREARIAALAAALRRAHDAMIGVNIFVTSREKINHPTGTEWWHAEMDAVGSALAPGCTADLQGAN